MKTIEIYNQLVKNRRLTGIMVLCALVLTYFASWFPDFENVVGLEGARISSLVAFGSLNGMILGPYLGPVVSFTGILLHNVVGHTRTDTFHLISPLFVAFSSTLAGLCITHREKVAIALYSIVVLAWYITPVGREVFYYPWYHVLTLAFFMFMYRLRDREEDIYIFTFLFATGLLAVLGDHILGSTVSLLIFELPADLFVGVIYIYPVERTILAFVSAFIMFMLIMILRNTILESQTFREDIENENMEQCIEYVDDVKNIIKNEK